MDSRQALQELQQFRSTRRPAQDYYSQAQQEVGTGAAQQRAQELRGLIRGTEQALRGVESSVSGRTQGSLVTEAQRSALANLERRPLGEQFREQQGALSEQDALYQNLLGEAGRRAGFAYQSDADRQSALQEQYNTLFAREEADRQAAEQRRQFEEQLRFSREQEARLSREAAATRAAAQGGQYDISKILESLRSGQGSSGAAMPDVRSATPVDVNRAFSSGGLGKVSSPKPQGFDIARFLGDSYLTAAGGPLMGGALLMNAFRR